MRTVLSEEDLNWIVDFALEQTTVWDVLDIIAAICVNFSCDIVTPPRRLMVGKITPPGFLDDNRHLKPIYSHAIKLINSQGDALLIYECGFCDGIPKDESLAAFLIALEFCDSPENLDYLADLVLDEIIRLANVDLFSREEELMAIFEKRRELLERESE